MTGEVIINFDDPATVYEGTTEQERFDIAVDMVNKGVVDFNEFEKLAGGDGTPCGMSNCAFR
jgi:hypothetical protein